MDQTRPRIVGIPWYRPEEYERICEVMQDGTKLPASYAYWLSSAESVESAVSHSGLRVLRVEIEPRAFLAWCEKNGLAPDGSARTKYATEKAALAG